LRISEKRLADAETCLIEGKDKIKKIRENELHRIRKEFKHHKYAERFDVVFDIVSKALFGEADKHKL
jgi:hypothetical protein